MKQEKVVFPTKLQHLAKCQELKVVNKMAIFFHQMAKIHYSNNLHHVSFGKYLPIR